MRKLAFWQNAAILVASNLFTGSLGFIFSIILSNELGAQGVGIYHLVMPIYGLFQCATCGGVVTAISKIVAEQNSKNNMRELYKSITTSIAFFAFWTLLISVFIVILAPVISESVLKDARTYYPILAFIPALTFVSISSILKGYFYGLQSTSTPAVIDIFEKAMRIVVLVLLLNYLKNYELMYQVSGAIIAVTLGELTSLGLLYAFYKKYYYTSNHKEGKPDNTLQIIVNVLKISIPLCINGFLSTMMGTFVAIMVPKRLQDAGYTVESALALYGKFTGMGFTIVTFPSIIIGAMATMLVPAISEASTKKNGIMVNKRIYSTIKLTIAVAAISVALFLSLPAEIGKLFYNRNDLGNIIYYLSFGLMCSYIESTLFGVLNGLGRQNILLRNSMILSVIDIGILYALIGIPEINIYAYAIDFLVSPFIGVILNGYEIHRFTGLRVNIKEIFLVPVSIAAAVAFIIKYLKPLLYTSAKSPNMISIILLAAGIGVFIVVYLLINPFVKKST